MASNEHAADEPMLSDVLMGRHVLTYHLSGEDQPHGTAYVAAFLLLAHYAADNAGELGIAVSQSTPKLLHNKANILVIDPDTTREMVDGIVLGLVDALGLDHGTFVSLLSTISDEAFPAAAAVDDLKAGDLDRNDASVLQAVAADILMEAQYERHSDFVLPAPAGIMSAAALAGAGHAAKDPLEVCLPALVSDELAVGCGHVAVLADDDKVHTASFAPDTAMAARLSMALVVEGVPTGIACVRQGDTLQGGVLESADGAKSYEVVLADEASFSRLVARQQDRKLAGRARLDEDETAWSPEAIEGYLAPMADGSQFVPTRDACLLRAISLLGKDGVAAVQTSSRGSYGRAFVNSRGYLLDKNLVDAVVELPKDTSSMAPFNNEQCIWFLRKGREAGEGILLARLEGDGAKAAGVDLTGLLDVPYDENEAAQAAVRLILDRDEAGVPMTSVMVTREQVRETSDLSLRFSSYAESVDVMGRLRDKASGWDGLLSTMRDDIDEEHVAEKDMRAALGRIAGQGH